MSIPLGRIIDEIFSGGELALVAVLLLVIAYLIYEIRNLRKTISETEARLEEERKETIKVLSEIQDKFMNKSETMINKYHSAIISQQESAERLKAMISTLITFVSNNKR